MTRASSKVEICDHPGCDTVLGFRGECLRCGMKYCIAHFNFSVERCLSCVMHQCPHYLHIETEPMAGTILQCQRDRGHSGTCSYEGEDDGVMIKQTFAVTWKHKDGQRKQMGSTPC